MWSILVLILALSRTGTSMTETLNFLDSEPLRFAIDRDRMNRNSDEFKGEYGNLSPPSLLGSKDFHDFIEGVRKLKHDDYVEKESQENDADNDYYNLKNRDIDEYEEKKGTDNDDEENDQQIDKISDILKKILKEQSIIGQWKAPLILIEESDADRTYLPWIDNGDKEFLKIDDYTKNDDLETIYPAPWKRSRYYRRYPWKRQNSRSRYDHDISRYLCTPTREDVFQLLVALHDARQGNKSRTVNFCNRRRPAGSVFTNIRFLGRKK